MWRVTQGPTQGRSTCPSPKGSSSSSAMSPSAFRLNPAPCVESSKATSTGVTPMPTRFDTEALHRAAGTLPRPIEVKAMEDCTVEGSTHRNIRPA